MRSPVSMSRVPAPSLLRPWMFATVIAACGLAPGRLAAVAATGVAHPLDPLSKDELVAAVQILKAEGKVGPTARFPMIALDEPPKQEVRGFTPGDPVQRRAFAVVYDERSHRIFETVVDLKDRMVVSCREVPGAQPGYHGVDNRIIQEVVRADPRWKEAIRKRGVKNPEDILFDVWGPGPDLRPEERGGRSARVIFFFRGHARNPFARPIEGLVVSVDLEAKKVTRSRTRAPRCRR